MAGYIFPPKEISWLKRDVLLFASSIGAYADELHFLYELHPRFTVFPTYPLILPFKLTDQEVIEFYGRNALNDIPGAPDLDLRYAVDGQRQLTIHKPLPTASTGKRFELRNRVIGIYDKGNSGSSLETEQQIVDQSTNEIYTTTRTSSFLPGQGNWKGPRGPTSPTYPPPKRAPDASHVVETTENTVFLYRLNGDYNPLHAVPEVGVEMGLGGVIVHGLYTYSSVCHGLLRQFGDGDPNRLKVYQARFVSPVRPGDKLITDMWHMGVIDGWVEIRFTTRNQTGQVVLGNGRALMLPQKLCSHL